MAREHSCPYFVKLDEDILQDPQIRNLIEESGYEGLGIYLGILTLFRNYHATSYMIPTKSIKTLAKRDFDISVARMEKIVTSCVVNHLLDITEIDGEEYFYSRRRKKELFGDAELKQKQQEAADNTNRKLGRGKYRNNG